MPIVIGGAGVLVLAGAFLALRRRRSAPAVAAAAGPAVPSSALPTSWDDPGAMPEPDPSPPEARVSSVPALAPEPPAASATVEAAPPRQRTIVVHVTPKEPDGA